MTNANEQKTNIGAILACGDVRPMRWGMQAGALHGMPWEERVLREFGVDLWVLFHPPVSSGSVPLSRITDTIRAVDAWCERQGIDWVSHLEAANYHATFIDERGRYRFGEHTVMMRPVDGDPDRVDVEVQ